jgi:hypothetical protein
MKNRIIIAPVLALIAMVSHVSGEMPALPPPPDNATMDAYDNQISKSLRERMIEDIHRSGETVTPEQAAAALTKYIAAYQEKNQQACMLAEGETKALRVSGVVTDASGGLLSNATIQFSVSLTRFVGKTFKMQQEIKAPFETRTDDRGSFTITNLSCRSAEITNVIFNGRNMMLTGEEARVFAGAVAKPVAVVVETPE